MVAGNATLQFLLIYLQGLASAAPLHCHLSTLVIMPNQILVGKK